MASDAATGRGRTVTRERLFGWIDGRLAALCLASLAVVFVCLLLQVRYGPYDMTFRQAWKATFNPAVLFNLDAWDAFLFGGEFPEKIGTESRIIWSGRLPRVLVGVLVGMCLAVSGAIFQAVTRNELASPYILGVSSGAGLTILVTLVFLGSVSVTIPVVGVVLGLQSLLPLLAALGGIVAFLLVYAIAWKNGTSPVRLVLAGVIVGTIFQSLETAMFLFEDNIAVVQTAIAWTTGSLISTDWEQVRIALPWTVLSVGLALLGARQLNVLLLGESTAKSLGMNVERVRFALSAVAVLAAAASIAVAGIVGFVGLIVPHMVRNIIDSDYRKLMIGCLFVGPALMVAADAVARLGMLLVFDELIQLPAGIVTGLLGGPYFLYLMRRRGQLGEI